MNMIHFDPITAPNFNDCISIQTGIDEKYLKPILYQIALSYVFPSKIPLAIYENDVIIGYVSFERDTEP